MLYGCGKGKYEQEYERLWTQLVPLSGQANTVQGELVRAIGKLASEYTRNGNANWDRGFRMLTNYLWKYLRDQKAFSLLTIAEIERDIQEIRGMGNGSRPLNYQDGEDAFDRISDRVVEWCRYNSELIAKPGNSALKR